MNQTKDENVFTHKHLVSQREPELNLDFHSFFFFQLCPWYVKVSQAGIEPVPQQQFKPQEGQHWIPNPPNHKGSPGCSFVFFWLCLWHAEVSESGIEPHPQQRPESQQQQ